ncbi:hypothetical protein BDV12DRAFT_191972 [Aspergillus spectabilis]
MPDLEDVRDAIHDFIVSHNSTFGAVSLFYILMDMFFPGWDDFLFPDPRDYNDPLIEVE